MIKNKIAYEKVAYFVILLGAVIRFAIIPFTAISGDACWHASVARFIAENMLIPLFEGLGRPVFWAPPLFHIISAFFYSFLGELGLKLVAPITGTLSLLFVYLIVKELFDKRIALLATVFVTFLPNHMYMSTLPYVDTTLSLLLFISVYCALKNKIILASIFSGLAMLTKYHAAFIIPVIFFILVLNNKDKIKKLLTYSGTTIAVGSWWYIRNWLLLGNPVWDFLNNFFKGYVIEKIARTPSILYLFMPTYLVTFYLDLFGVPSGDYTTLLRLNIPFLATFLFIWFIGTLLYIIPLVIGLGKIKIHEKQWKILLVWLSSFLVFGLLYVYDIGVLYARFLMPTYPIFGILWAHGILMLAKKIKDIQVKNILVTLLVFVILGFVATEFVKAPLAAKEWHNYDKDFAWVQNNIPQHEKILITRGQCIPYYLKRETVDYNDKIFRNIEKGSSDIKYVLVEQLKTRRDTPQFPDHFLKYLEGKELLYNNLATGVNIYKIGEK